MLGSYTYISEDWNDSKFQIIEDTLIWPNEPVKSIDVDHVKIEILTDKKYITVDINRSDPRDQDDMDLTTKDHCDRRSEGCCFEHSGCGYEKCLTHYPLQEISFECDTSKLVGATITKFVPEGHGDFHFLLSDGTRVPFIVWNSLPEREFTLNIFEW